MHKQKSRKYKRYIRKRLKAFFNEKLLISSEKILKIVREATEEELKSLFNLDKELLDKTEAKGYVQEAAPEEAKENDIWLQPKTEEFHILKNGEWKKAGDKDILPALKTSMISRAGLIKF